MEGLVNVPYAVIQSNLAFPALIQMLELAGWSPDEVVADTQTRARFRGENWDHLADTLCRFIFADWQYAYIDALLLAEYPFLAQDEREYVALLSFHTLKSKDVPMGGRTMEEWRSSVNEVLRSIPRESVMDIEGVTRFRLRELLDTIEQATRDTVEQFFTDREYEEFVSMLRYILESQSPTTQVLHVYCSEERVWICDVQGDLVRDPDVAKAAADSSDEEVNSEDLAMSILITRSPRQIVIHDLFKSAPWPSFAETLERVFIGRTIRCSGCRVCHETGRTGSWGPMLDFPHSKT